MYLSLDNANVGELAVDLVEGLVEELQVQEPARLFLVDANFLSNWSPLCSAQCIGIRS